MKLFEFMSDDDLNRLFSMTAEDVLKTTETKTEKPKGGYKNNNLIKVTKYVNSIWPEKDLNELYDEFGYKEHIKGIFTLDENEFKVKFPQTYATILEYYDETRRDFRTSFEAARDVCANFIVEDLFAKPFPEIYPNIRLDLNEDETRDIEKYPNSKPDYVFRNLDTGKSLRVDLKTDWTGSVISKGEYFFRGNEYREYRKYNAVALIWCPYSNKFTTLDFRKEVEGHTGIDSSKGGKQGFWADLHNNKFDDVFLNFGEKSIFLDSIVKKLDKLSRQ